MCFKSEEKVPKKRGTERVTPAWRQFPHPEGVRWQAEGHSVSDQINERHDRLKQTFPNTVDKEFPNILRASRDNTSHMQSMKFPIY